MGFVPFTISDSIAQTEPGRPHIPEGYYLVECMGVKPTAEDYDKTPGFLYDFKIVEGVAGVGRSIQSYATMKEGAEFSNGRYMGALGQGDNAKKLAGTKIPDYRTFAALGAGISKAVTGHKAVALVSDQVGNNGRAFSGIVEKLPAEEWTTLKTSVPGPAASPQAPLAAAANGNAAAPVPGLEAQIGQLFA